MKYSEILNEVNLNIQDIIPLPVLNNIPQQKQYQGSLNAQMNGLILALRKFGLVTMADWLEEKKGLDSDTNDVVNSSVLDRIPQQPESNSDFQRQGWAAKVIADKLGLYDAASHLKNLM
jgi:hypothetical protein